MEFIVTIIIILIVRNVYQVLKQNQARQQRGGGPGQPEDFGAPTPKEKVPQYEWDNELAQDWSEFDWYEEQVRPPQPAPQKITVKPRAPKPKATTAATAAPGKPEASLTLTGAAPPFRQSLQPADLVGGIIWAQILGTRGGIQRNKRRL